MTPTHLRTWPGGRPSTSYRPGSAPLICSRGRRQNASRPATTGAGPSRARHLDLVLRQAGISLGEALAVPYRPGSVRRLYPARHPTLARAYPELEFKVDPTSEWDTATMTDIASTGRCAVLDFKSFYTGTPVDLAPDPVLYRSAAELFPDAVLEDAALTEETRVALAGALTGLSWDAPIHSLADVDALTIPPRFLNIKPWRFGSARAALLRLAWKRVAAAACPLWRRPVRARGRARPDSGSRQPLLWGRRNDVAPRDYHGPRRAPACRRARSNRRRICRASRGSTGSAGLAACGGGLPGCALLRRDAPETR